MTRPLRPALPPRDTGQAALTLTTVPAHPSRSGTSPAKRRSSLRRQAGLNGGDEWVEVLGLPGCFAAGAGMEELREALTGAISLYLADSGDARHVELEDARGPVTEHRMLARTA